MVKYGGFFYGLLVGIIIGLFITHGSKSFVSYGNTVTYSIEPLPISSLAVYNKTCGVRYWNRKTNFGNKDDLLFFPVISTILTSTESEIIIIEFGANTGQFSEAVLNTPHKIPYVVHSIEPIVALFQLLKNRSAAFKKEQNDKHFHYNIAISDRSGQLPIYAPNRPGEAATLGIASQSGFGRIADVSVTTLPDFIKQYHIKTPISLIKIDVEGFEPEVIKGMNLKTNAAIFPLFSFETGGTWRDDRSVQARNYTLKSFVAMLDDLGYDSFFYW